MDGMIVSYSGEKHTLGKFSSVYELLFLFLFLRSNQNRQHEHREEETELKGDQRALKLGAKEMGLRLVKYNTGYGEGERWGGEGRGGVLPSFSSPSHMKSTTENLL